MDLTRRDALKLLGTTAALAAVGEGSAFAASSIVLMPRMPRMPLDEFVKNPKWLAALRTGVREMKRRKPSDPLSWFFQASIHGVPEEAIKEATKEDPNVPNVVKYWNQCPHGGQNSANFLPWHRGYTYHFERILRIHTGDSSFSLPYWNYHPKKNRKFPREYGVQHLDGNLENDTDENLNPLFHAARDFYFTSYEHPFSKGFPILELSDSAVDITLPMNAPMFFGETERKGLGGGIADEDVSTRGLLKAPPFSSCWRYFQIQTSGVENALGLIGRFDLADCCVRELHWGQLPFGANQLPPRLPPVAPGFQGAASYCVGQEKRPETIM